MTPTCPRRQLKQFLRTAALLQRQSMCDSAYTASRTWLPAPNTRAPRSATWVSDTELYVPVTLVATGSDHFSAPLVLLREKSTVVPLAAPAGSAWQLRNHGMTPPTSGHAVCEFMQTLTAIDDSDAHTANVDRQSYTHEQPRASTAIHARILAAIPQHPHMETHTHPYTHINTHISTQINTHPYTHKHTHTSRHTHIPKEHRRTRRTANRRRRLRVTSARVQLWCAATGVDPSRHQPPVRRRLKSRSTRCRRHQPQATHRLYRQWCTATAVTRWLWTARICHGKP